MLDVCLSRFEFCPIGTVGYHADAPIVGICDPQITANGRLRDLYILAPAGIAQPCGPAMRTAISYLREVGSDYRVRPVRNAGPGIDEGNIP